MILLWVSTALAVPVGPGQPYESILDALAGETTDPVSLELTEDYTVSAEGPFGAEVGIIVARDLVLSSNVEGEPRQAPPMWIQESTVILQDLEIAKTAVTYTDPSGQSKSAGDGTARLLVQQSRLTATRVVIDDAGSSNRNAVLAYDSTVVLEQVQIRNGVFTPCVRDETQYAVALVNDQGGGGSLTLTETQISNLQGGGIYIGGEGTAQKLTFTDLEIEGVSSTLQGSAIRSIGQSNVSGTALWITGATNTAVHLGEGDHSISGGQTQDCEGSKGGVFALQGGAELFVNAVNINGALAEQGGLAWLEGGSRIELLDVVASDLTATEGAGVYGPDAELEIRGGHYCDLVSRADGAFASDRQMDVSGAVFSLAPEVLFSSGGTTRLVNNTFIEVGVLLNGASDTLEFTNNALVQVLVPPQSSGWAPSALRFTFYDAISQSGLGSQDPGFGAVYAEDPGFIARYDPATCSSDPIPDTGSPLINTGDPDLQDPDGSRSDIGALPGLSEGTEPDPDPDPDPDPEDAPEDVHLSGGCGGGFQAGILLLPLLGWRRRRDLAGA